MTEQKKPTNFIRQIIDKDLAAGKNDKKVVTRFPPEPNGYLHIGHAKSICLNFGIAEDYTGRCNLRFDDTNPSKEDIEFVDAIKMDVQWLGFDWSELHYASDYFQKLYDYAVALIKQDKAYVDDLSAHDIREYRGTLKEPGKNSPYRERTVEENLDLLIRLSIEYVKGLITIKPAPAGRFTQCMIILIVCLIPSKALPIHCVRWNLKITVHYMTGFWISWMSSVTRNK